MIKFHCSKCDKKIGVPEEYSGKLVRCPRCKQPARVPELELEPLEDQVADSIWTDDLLGTADTAESVPGSDRLPHAAAPEFRPSTPAVSQPQAAAAPAMGHQVVVMPDGFKNPTFLTRFVQSLLVLSIAYSCVSLWSNWKERGLLKDFESGAKNPLQSLAEANANDERQRKIAIGGLIVLAVSGVSFLVWVYRSNYNARMLGAAGMEYTPGWSVGWFFVPIANLWKPYNAMKEIAAASKNPAAFGSEKDEPMVVLWWLSWIAGGVLGQVAFRLAGNAEDVSGFLKANLAQMGSDVLQILAAAAGFILLQKIYSYQMFHVTKRY